MVLFSQYLRDVSLPVCVYKKGKGVTRGEFPLFKLFPVSEKHV